MTMTKARYGLMIVGLAALAGCRDGDAAQAQTRQDTQQQVQAALGDVPMALDTGTAAALSGAFRGAASRALPAVVNIDVIGQQEQQRLPFNVPGLTPPPNQEELVRGTGSGFIINEDGHILTNNHVVENAERITVRMVSGQEYAAEVVGADPNTDIAVIKITPRAGESLPVSEFGDSDKLNVGDWVLALGNPLGLDFTVTTGIVSAKSRSIGILRNQSNTQLEAFIQTDAAINRGNSGGPLVDLLGRVVGINSAIQSQTGYFSGAGFAIPINLATKVANDLIEFGVVHRPRLGVQIQDVDAADAEVYGLPRVAGAEVNSITPDQPAQDAGMQMGDVIVSVEGEDIRNVAELQARIARFQPGDRVRLGIIRYGTALEKTIRLGEFEQPGQTIARARPRADDEARLGFTVRPLPEEFVRFVPEGGSQFVQIADVDPYGPASRALGQNWVILKINGENIRGVRDVQRIANGLESGDVVSVVYVLPRNGEQPAIANYRIR